MRNVFSYITLFLLLLGHATVQGQFTARLDSNQLLIGEQTRLHLDVTIPAETDSFWLNSPLDTLSVTILKETPWQRQKRNGGLTLSKKYLLSAYDSAFIKIPPFRLFYTHNEDTAVVNSNDLPLSFGFPNLSDTTALAPIKPIIEEPTTWVDYLPWVLGVLGVAIVILLIYWWMKRQQKMKEAVLPPPPRPAHEIALEKLDALRKEQLWQQGEFKAFQSRLSYIFREYLENRYRFRALEMITSEIDIGLQKNQITEEKREEALDVLRKADLVKFAKAEMPVAWHKKSIDIVEQWVRETKYIPPQPEETNEEDS